MSILSIVLTLSFAYSAPLHGDTFPAAEGFDTASSIPQEIAVGEANMLAMGGYTAWNQTRYIT
tara:strand:+ start:393 stop:581 length:189 start_codon:yes stop_codon:yes gene_type:complete